MEEENGGKREKKERKWREGKRTTVGERSDQGKLGQWWVATYSSKVSLVSLVRVKPGLDSLSYV